MIPDTQSQEKKDMLRLCGAELIEVPALPYSNPNNYQHVTRRLADELRKTEKNGVLFADQWNNLDNRKAHYLSTGPEIWQQTEGKVDGFICAVGTGGTLAGTSQYLREMKKDIVIGCADPRGAAMYTLFSTGEAKATEGGSITEGIGLGRVTPIIDGLKVEKPYLIPDEEAVPIIFDLLEHEGLCLGGSSGINVAGAIRLAKDMGPGHTIVTVLCRLRHALSVQAVQSAVPALQETAGAGVAGAQIERDRSVREGVNMPTECLFREDSYLKDCGATVVAVDARGRHRARPHRVLCRLRRPAGGPRHADRQVGRAASRSPTSCSPIPARPRSRTFLAARRARRFRSAITVQAVIDWELRYARMRMHTALHLLSAVLPYPVTGGSIGEAESRLDFDIPDAGLDKDAITAKLAEMIAADAEVTSRWISDAELEANPDAGQDHVGEAADGHRPGAADRNRRLRPAALRRHPCALAPARSARFA